MSRNQFIENLRKSKYADLAKNSLRLVILEQHTEIEALERQLEEAREENKKLKSEVFVIMRSGAHSDFPVSFKHTKEEADSEALKLDKQEKFFPHYVEQLKKEGENE
jgi:hypothetical protein